MLNIYLDDKITLDQQVLENKENIQILKQYIKEAYKTHQALSTLHNTIEVIQTNAPTGTNSGWLIDTIGNLFKITGNYLLPEMDDLTGTTTQMEYLNIAFYCNIKGQTGATGAQGVGIEIIENAGYSQGEGFTISHIKATLTNGEEEYFDVQAKDGQSGTAPFITIDSPDTATSGTLTSEQLATLQSSDNSYIMFANEKYYLMDKQTESGYLVYTHVGHDSTDNYWTKCITITILTLGWVLNTETTTKYYYHNFYLRFSSYSFKFHLILPLAEPISTFSDLVDVLAAFNFKFTENGYQYIPAVGSISTSGGSTDIPVGLCGDISTSTKRVDILVQRFDTSTNTFRSTSTQQTSAITVGDIVTEISMGS